MLWGHTVRSPHAHARIVSIDISGAVGMPGVHAVLTHEDVPGAKRYGLEFADQPVLAYRTGALLRRTRRARRRRASGAGAPCGRADPGRVRAARAGDRPGARAGAGAAASRPADDGPRLPGRSAPERRPLACHQARRSRGRRRRDRLRALRGRDPGSGVPRAGVGACGARRRGRRRHLRRDAVAARRPRPGRAVPEPRARAGAHSPRGRGRRVRRPRGSLDADPRRAARAAREPSREDRLQPGGVVRRSHPPSPGEDLGGASRDEGGQARERARAHPARRRRVRLELDRGDVERRRVRGRPVCGRQRADREHVRVHEQSTVRRDARLRRGSVVLCARGADGQARRRARHRPGRAAAAECARARRLAADRPEDHRARFPSQT